VEGLREGEKVLMNPPLVPGTEGPPPETPEIPKPAESKAKEPAKEGGAGAVDRGRASREEQRKRFESMSPEEQKKAIEQFRRQRGEQGGEGRGG
jgi:hypothetical protein